MKVVHNQLSSNPLLGHAIRSQSHSLQGSEFEDPDDPTGIAEAELTSAANSIDAAAKKLEKLRPRRSVQETDENLNFDEMILEAAKSIACATSALVKAASAAQRELVDSGRVSRKATSDSDDGQWSEGLVSAAQMVAAATHALVEAANSLVQGHATEEKLISAAKQVASSTAQLLVACKVKASLESDATRRLQAAGNAVKRATDNLVRAAQQALSQEEERQLVLNRRMVGGIAQVINARADVLRIERELDEARGRLAFIQKAKYHDKAAGGFTDETDDSLEIVHDSSRLDSLLESSAERISSATNSFNIMRQQQVPPPPPPHQSLPPPPPPHTIHGYAPVVPVKPAVSPKPGTKEHERKMNNGSPYSTMSNDSSITSAHGPPAPPSRSFHPAPTFNANASTTLNGNRQQTVSQLSEDLYSRTRQQGQDYSSAASSTVSTPTIQKTFMKPSDFLPNPKPTPLAGQGPSPLSSFQRNLAREDSQSTSSYSQECAQWDSGPIQSEQVFQTTTPDGSISLKRIFQQQQTSSTSKVTSTRKVFQQRQQQQSED
jgi:hypothetical protein